MEPAPKRIATPTPSPTDDLAPPHAAALAESLRAFGYDLSTALADLADNSLFHHSRNIHIHFHWAGTGSAIAIADNGDGMDEATLVNAMRVSEHDDCPIAGVAAAALAISECFLSAFNVQIEAANRIVGLSLWRPDLHWTNVDTKGPSINYLPNEIWSLGLGHLGQAYLWCLAMLPYSKPDQVNIVLQDFDRTRDENLCTCVLTRSNDLDLHKTRVARRWLESRGFRPIVVERPFDEFTRVSPAEPALALCGFDGKGPRHLLEDAGFRRVVECGLGGRYHNFDSILLHSLPRDSISARDFWNPHARPAVDPATKALIHQHPEYANADPTCGFVQLVAARLKLAYLTL